jgi:ABC-type Fe3+/spermidine/putrescine transport system ATPase subunit
VREIDLRQIQKRFRKRVVLDELNLRLCAGEITSLLGRSGSGKTTLARIVAGLVQPDAGSIAGLNGQRVMLQPQDFVIWPHLSVRKNVELGLPARGSGQTVERCLELFHLQLNAADLAGELSFGQQHRVALARTFAFGPQLLILDEPLAHLDEPLRRTVAREIAQICQAKKVTALWITHDPAEAFEVGHSIAVLDQGKIAQIGSSEEVYWRPTTLTVAMLSGEVNVIRASDETLQRALAPDAFESWNRSDGRSIAFRPESARLVKASAGRGIRISRSVFAGAGYYHILTEFESAVRIFDAEKLSLEDGYHIQFNAKPWLTSTAGLLS